MATDTIHDQHDVSTDNGSWEGAANPFKVGYGKLMIWYFLLSDAFTFAGFLIAYGTLRFSSPSWPVPDFVFSTFPFLTGHHPLLFVTFMTFVLLFSSFTMIRAVQEGHRENRRGVVIWMFLTIIGGAGFLGCQAWEWTTLIGKEHMSLTTNPFGTHTTDGVYLGADGKESDETFKAGASYLLHKIDVNGHGDDLGHSEAHIGAAHEASTSTAADIATVEHAVEEQAATIEPGPEGVAKGEEVHAAIDEVAEGKESHAADGQGRDGDATASHSTSEDSHSAETHAADDHSAEAHAADDHAADAHGAHHYPGPGDYPDAVVDERGFIHRKYIVASGQHTGKIQSEAFGPKAFGALFFFITGFHGFHVLSGVVFLLIILINVMSGLYIARRNKNEMVEKIGLYWHFVDLVWVFVFLVFYLI